MNLDKYDRQALIGDLIEAAWLCSAPATLLGCTVRTVSTRDAAARDGNRP
jgi:hypothetical protein